MTNILLIDLSSICHPIFHTSASDPNPDATSIRTLERVRALASGQPHVAVCADSGRSFRRDIDPAYKANRPPSDAALQHQIALVIDALKAEGFPVWAAAGFEADDLIATATEMATRPGVAYANPDETDADRAVTIASADKDLLQLVSDRVTIKSLRDGSAIDADAVVAKFGVRPDQVRDYLSLVGDASDNVKGAAGIGEKKAAALLQTFGNLEDLYAAIDRNEAAMQLSTLKSLTEFRERWPVVRSLITLRTDAPVPFEDVFKERVPMAVFKGEPMESEEPQVPLPEVVDEPSVPYTAPASLSTPPAGEAKPGALMSMPRSGVPMPTRLVPDFDLANGPQTYEQAKLMAADLFAAKLFSGYGSAPAVLATILIGKELNLSTGVSLRGIHIIDSKQSFSADLIRSLCLRSPACEYFRITERTPQKATWVTKRTGDPEVSLTFTIEEGRAAWPKDQKAWDASGWGKRPVNMVTKTAAATLARLVYPDIALGMYCNEELTGDDL